MCLGKISKDFTINNMKKAGLKWSVQTFSVNYNAIDTNDVLDNSKGPIICVSLNKHLIKARPALDNIKSVETVFYPFTVSVNKCGGSFNTMQDPYARAVSQIK